MPRFCRENRRLQGARALAFLQSLRVEEGCRRRAAAERSVSVKAFRLTCSTLAAMAFCAARRRPRPPPTRTAPTPTQSAQKPDKAAKPERKSEKPPHKGDKSTKPAASSDKSRDAHKADAADKSGKPAKPATQTSAGKLSTRAEKSTDPARKADSTHKSETATKTQAAKGAPGAMPLAVPTRPVTATSSIPPSGVIDHAGADVPRIAPPFTPSTIPLRPSTVAAPPPPPVRRGPTFAMATSSTTSPLDLSAIKQALELVHKGRPDEATNIESTITDPVGRKLVEWAILRGDDTDLDFPRYAAFISTNPSWPGITSLRRRAEAALWQKESDSRAVIEFFRSEPPRTAKGRFVLARALLVQGDRAGAQAALREAWRKDSFSADTEAQAREVVWRPDHAGRRQGAHGCALRCRGRRCRLAGGAPSRAGRGGHRQSARCGDQQVQQGQGVA